MNIIERFYHEINGIIVYNNLKYVSKHSISLQICPLEDCFLLNFAARFNGKTKYIATRIEHNEPNNLIWAKVQASLCELNNKLGE